MKTSMEKVFVVFHVLSCTQTVTENNLLSYCHYMYINFHAHEYELQLCMKINYVPL